ncbi:hypothetical protein Anapl_10794 [Anas platyrhynchos]|uniref:Uncharacterized protein n=1 Tax=Anas platyrhynchos TaxID=8839 RepID=R0M8J0_ANAPL|nr:hypothetical protein Anapl_10794 [Anas platyrhynchos]
MEGQQLALHCYISGATRRLHGQSEDSHVTRCQVNPLTGEVAQRFQQQQASCWLSTQKARRKQRCCTPVPSAATESQRHEQGCQSNEAVSVISSAWTSEDVVHSRDPGSECHNLLEDDEVESRQSSAGPAGLEVLSSRAGEEEHQHVAESSRGNAVAGARPSHFTPDLLEDDEVESRQSSAGPAGLEVLSSRAGEEEHQHVAESSGFACQHGAVREESATTSGSFRTMPLQQEWGEIK